MANPSLVYRVAFRLCVRSCEEALKGCTRKPTAPFPTPLKEGAEGASTVATDTQIVPGTPHYVARYFLVLLTFTTHRRTVLNEAIISWITTR